MKKFLLTLGCAASCCAASAHSYSHDPQHLGRHDSDSIITTSAVPETTPTVTLVLVSVASLAVLTAYLRGRKSGARE